MELESNIFNERSRINGIGGGIFDDLLGETRRIEFAKKLSNNYRMPLSTINEGENEFTIYVELPGIERANVKLKVDGRNIEVRAASKKDALFEDEAERRYFKRFRGFFQSLQLPKEADTNCIEKTHRNGLLKLKVPKKKAIKPLAQNSN